jgi:hypothetical protein
MSALLAVGVFGAMLLSVWSTGRSADRAPDFRQGINKARAGCDSLLKGYRGGHSGGDAIIATHKYIRPVQFDTPAQLTLRLACVFGSLSCARSSIVRAQVRVLD